MRALNLLLLALLSNSLAIADQAMTASPDVSEKAKIMQACSAKTYLVDTKPNPEMILKDIKSCGAKTVVRRLTCGTDSPWHSVLRQIESGEQRWVDVAGQLASGTDAGTSEDILVSLARALVKNPGDVLRLAGSQTFLSTDDLCGAPFIEPEPAYLRQYLIEAERAVKSLDDSEIEEQRAKCLAQIEKMIRDESAESSAPAAKSDP